MTARRKPLKHCIRAAVAGFLAAACLSASTPPLKVGVGRIVPISYFDEKDRAVGFAVDVLNEAARREGISVTWMRLVKGPRPDLQSRTVDLLSAAMATEERKREFYVSEPWWSEQLTLLTRAGAAQPLKRLGIQQVYVEFARPHFDPATFVIDPNSGGAAAMQAKAVCKGTLDGAFITHGELHDLFLNRPEECTAVRLQSVDTAITYGLSIIARKSDAGIAERLRRQIDNLTLDGTLLRLAAAHPPISIPGALQLQERIRHRYQTRMWITGACIFVSLIVFLVWFLWNRQRQLNRTRQSEARILELNRRLDGHVKQLQAVLQEKSLLLEELEDRVRKHRAAVEALRESEERYRRLVEASPDAIVLQSEGRTVYMNPAALRLLGAGGLGDVVGRPVMDFIDPQSHALSSQRIQHLTEQGGEAPLVELTFRRLDGTPFAVELVSTGFIYEGKPAVQAVFRDITERRRGEQALRSSEAQFRAVFSGAVDGMFILDEEWRCVDCNSAAVHITGVVRDKLIGTGLAAILGAQGHDETLASIAATAAPGARSGHVQFMRPDKRMAEIDYTVQPDFLPGRHLLIARDVTQQLRLEAQLRQAQKMEAVGRLAGGVAHDFNNLLTVISGYSQIALGQVSEVDPLRGSILEISRAGERATALTRQLLAFSRKQVLKPEIVDLNSVIADTEKILRRLIGEDIEVVTKLAPDLPKVKVDTGQIEQVVMNLALNARDAMPSGGRLVIETAEAALDANAARSRLNLPAGRYLMLAVTDNGTGMDAETLSHVFEPFFTTKAQGKGTGLGLSTVYGIVKQSGGDIWVYSEPGRGTVFKVYLPAAEAAEAVQIREESASPEPGTETVLVVEDESGVRDLITHILDSAGYRVLAAANGTEALRIGERFDGPIHLLVTDVVMPGMTGRELADRLLSVRPNLRVLHVSGYTGDAVLAQGISDQSTEFLQKPFTPRSLTRKVREVLNGPPRAGSK